MKDATTTSPNRAEFYGIPGSSYVYLKEIHDNKVVNTYCMYGIGANKVRIVQISEDPNADDEPITEGPYVHCYGMLIKMAADIQESNPLQVGERVIMKYSSEEKPKGEILELIYNPSNRTKSARVKWDNSTESKIGVDQLRREP